MMKRTLIHHWILSLLAVALAGTALSCSTDPAAFPWPSALFEGKVQAVYPEGYETYAREGVSVRFSSIYSDQVYTVKTDAQGCISAQLPSGLYRLSISDRSGDWVFNGSDSHFLVSGNRNASLKLVASVSGPLLIRELYVGGCSKAPKEGTYQSDQYVLLHNNTADVIYLDSLCFGTLTPYNATGVNHWMDSEGNFPPFAPVVTVVWRFPGDGTRFPMASGEDSLIALRGAIDHTQEYPLSVNLKRPDCFVCYNAAYFPNPLYHPAPGDLIRQDHILEVLVKTGQSNANTVSINSPTFLIFKSKGVSMEDWIKQEDVIWVTPGASSDVVVTIPWEWVIDAVEVFDGSSTGNKKRLPPDQDAGFVSQMETFKGYALTRKIDEEATLDAGYTVLMDSNNSSNDFYQSDKASLRP